MNDERIRRTILENELIGIVTFDSHGRIVAINKAAERIFHCRGEEISGEPAGILLTRPRLLEDDSDTARAVTGKRKDGKEIPLQMAVNGFFIDAKRYFNAIFRYPVEMREADEELFTRHLCVEQSPSIVLITDADGNIEYVNPKFTAITGYEPGEVMGRNPRLLKSGEKSPAEYDELWRTITSGKEWRGEFHNRKKDGEFYWASASISPVKGAGGVIRHYVAIQEDITERKAADEELRKAYDVISADLEAAAAIQRRLLPRAADLEGVRFHWLFYPSRFVAGDTFGYFPIEPGVFAFYLLDVSGHGVPAAMLSASLNWILSYGKMEDQDSAGTSAPGLTASPGALLKSLNGLFQEHHHSGQFITMIYGILEVAKSRITMSQAGLPPPLLRDSSGAVTAIGSGGFPIGILPGMDYEEDSFPFHPGDRLYLYSDGVTECFDDESRQFSGERLAAEIERLSSMDLPDQLKAMEEELIHWHGSNRFDDDVTMLAIERRR